MADNKYLSLSGLKLYDEKIKDKIKSGDEEALKAAKAYADSLSKNYDPAGTAQTKVDALANGTVKDNADAIAILNGVDTVEGSVKKQIADAKKDLEGKITDSVYNDTELKGKVSANEKAIATLNGTGKGSVSKSVADAIASIVADAPESFDTLKEISDWIASHQTDATAMNSQINANKTDITSLKALVGTLPEGTGKKTIVEYIDSKVSSVDFTDAIATAKQEAITTAASDAKTKVDSALSSAKTYADGLAKNYATAAQGVKADSALQADDIVTGTANGAIAVKGVDVTVKGLGSAAYTSSTEYEAAGTVKALADGQVATNKADITALKTKIENLESVTYSEISTDEINALFSEVTA